MISLGSSRKSKLLAAAVLALMAFSAAATATPIVTNGSFESGVPGNKKGLQNGARFGNLNSSGPSWDRWLKINGWTRTYGSGIEVQSNRTLSTIDAQEGTHYVELDSNSNSGMKQTLNLTHGDYVLKFWYSPRTAQANTNGIEYTIGGLAGGYVTTNKPVSAVVGVWTEIVTKFSVGKRGAYDLKFSATGLSDSYGGLLDNVSVAPVPLPAAGLGLMAALGGLASMKRRRKA